MEINPAAAFAMIDRMLGGTGQQAAVNRPLTEIEQNVVDSVVKLLLDGLSEAWKAVTTLTFGIRARETRPQMLQVAAPNEVVVTIIFDVRIGEVHGTINLAIPTSVVETAGANFGQAWQRQRREPTAVERQWMEENLGRVPIPVVPLIRTRVRAGAILALQEGEVIALPLAADAPLDVYASGVRKLTGRLASDQGRTLMLIEERFTSGTAVPSGVA